MSGFRGRPKSFWAILIVVEIVSTLAIAEFAVRSVRPTSRLAIEPGGFYVADPPGRYRLRPGYKGRMKRPGEFDIQVQMNSHGLRGAELEESSEAMRILTIGDSFAFGVGVKQQETFTARTAGFLTSSGRPTVGLNAGIPAFGVPDAVGWLERHGLKLEPDVVVLSIFLGNDLVDASPDREEILIVDGLLAPKESPRGVKAWLFRNSHLFALAKGFLDSSAMQPLRTKLGLGEPWTTRVLREEFVIYDKTATEHLAPAVDATEKALSKLAQLARDRNFELVALLIPSEMQVDPTRWLTVTSQLGLDLDNHDPEIPYRAFSELLTQNSIPFVYPAGELTRRIDAGEELYYPIDRHWTAEAHALAATQLAKFLLTGPRRPAAGEKGGQAAFLSCSTQRNRLSLKKVPVPLFLPPRGTTRRDKRNQAPRQRASMDPGGSLNIGDGDAGIAPKLGRGDRMASGASGVASRRRRLNPRNSPRQERRDRNHLNLVVRR